MPRRGYPVGVLRTLPPTRTDVHIHDYCLASLSGLIPHLATLTTRDGLEPEGHVSQIFVESYQVANGRCSPFT